MARRDDFVPTVADDDLEPGEIGKQASPVAADRRIVVHELGEHIGQGANPRLEIRPLGEREDLQPVGYVHKSHRPRRPDTLPL
jgi:hypothetical protein